MPPAAWSAAALLSLVLALAPRSAAQPTTTAKSLASFEGIEEPTVRYNPADTAFTPDDFVNITDRGDGVFRMFLRYRPGGWWDGDRATRNTDRQRAEVKGLGPCQKDGETFEYATTWRTNDTFRGSGRFCHVFQLKATDGDGKAPPLVVLSVLEGQRRAAVRYCSGNRRGFETARTFSWQPGKWQAVRIRIKPSTKDEGELTASVDGDDFQGVKNVPLYRPAATEYRPKWGLYRAIGTGFPLGDDHVEHRAVSAAKVQNISP
jgi:hypothetical protein